MTFDKNIMIAPTLLITAEGEVGHDRLKLIRERLGIAGGDNGDNSVAEILVGKEQIRLRAKNLDQRAVVGISFYEGAANHRRLYGGGKSQQLSKAVGIDQKKGLKVLDATAGLAADSFVLASLGADVQMLERSPVLALMIEEAIASARLNAETETDPDTKLLEIIGRMSVVQADAVDWLSQQQAGSWEVIYLDPMFPERRKKAAVKKEMQVVQQLLQEGQKIESERLQEEAALLEVALSKAAYRVVVKRPRHAPPLEAVKPGYSLEGKSTRFDIYPLRKIT